MDLLPVEHGHRRLRLHFENGIFLADFADCLKAVVFAYEQLEFLESRSAEILQILQVEDSDSGRTGRAEFEERYERLEKLFLKSDSRDYPERWMIYFDLLREFQQEGRLQSWKTDFAIEGFRVSFLKGELFSKPSDYKIRPENALVLDRCQINSPGFSDSLGAGKIVESIVKEVGDRNIKKATANKIEAEAQAIQDESRRKDRDQDSKDELSQVECAIKKAELMKVQAEALVETFKAMKTMGFSDDQAREFIANQIGASAQPLVQQFQRGTLQGIEALPADSDQNPET